MPKLIHPHPARFDLRIKGDARLTGGDNIFWMFMDIPLLVFF